MPTLSGFRLSRLLVWLLRYRFLVGCKTFTAEKLVDGGVVEEAWIVQDPMGQLRQTVTGLQSAMYHEFQMRAIGAGKPSPWSGAVKGLAA